MGLIVQKYGGTSVADPDRMRNVARHIAATREQGHSVVAVVSAMGKATDNLVELARQVSNNPHGREMDMLLTTGERISSALLCMALLDMGCDAMSFTGSQVGIITDTTHTKAKILEIKGDRVREAVGLGKVAVVAGFQGVSTAREITTLGCGGSDTTAVALAAALDADVCEIYTDVTGVFSADPSGERFDRDGEDHADTPARAALAAEREVVGALIRKLAVSNDSFTGTSGNDLLMGGQGDDILMCRAGG